MIFDRECPAEYLKALSVIPFTFGITFRGVGFLTDLERLDFLVPVVVTTETPSCSLEPGHCGSLVLGLVRYELVS